MAFVVMHTVKQTCFKYVKIVILNIFKKKNMAGCSIGHNPLGQWIEDFNKIKVHVKIPISQLFVWCKASILLL